MPGAKDGGPNLGLAQFSVFGCPPDTLDVISQACGPWLAASSIRGSPLEALLGPPRPWGPCEGGRLQGGP